jgi:hypothetical protein
MAVQDLSHLARGSLVADSSMHGGNTVSVVPPFNPPGSESEATQGIPTHSRPEPDIGPNNDKQLNVKISGSTEYLMTERTWKKVTPGG